MPRNVPILTSNLRVRRAVLLASFFVATAMPAVSRATDWGNIPAVWTSGPTPTRMAFYRGRPLNATDAHWYAYEQYGTAGGWKDTTAVPANQNFNSSHGSAVVVQVAPGNWETRLFYVKEVNGRGEVACARRDSAGNWSGETLPPLSAGAPGVSVYRGPAAVSNVYNTGLALAPQGSTARMVVYFVGDNNNLYSLSYNNGAWATSWRNLQSDNIGGPGNALEGQISATASFDNGAFNTSVWIARLDESLGMNSGPFDGNAATRAWTFGLASGTERTDAPAAVTWYDTGFIGNPSHAHTRVVHSKRTDNDAAWAAHFEPFGGLDPLDRSVGSMISAGIALGDCGGCPNPPSIYRVVALDPDYSPYVYYMDKGTDLNPSFTDVWTALPAAPYPAGLTTLTRLPFGAGLGAIYANEVEYIPSTGKWLSLPSLIMPDPIPTLGADGNLQVIAVDYYGVPSLDAFEQRSTGNWFNGGAFPTPTPPANTTFSKLVADRGAGGKLYVFGLGLTNDLASIAVVQETTGAWTAGMTLPGQTAKYSALATGQHGTALQLVGLSKFNGRAYLAAKQNSNGSWTGVQSQFGGLTGVKFTSIAAATSSLGRLQVFGLGTDRKAYVAGYVDGGGIMRTGYLLGGSNLTAIAVARGNSNFLQVIGLAADGSISLVAWQNGADQFFSGGPLSTPAPLSRIVAARDILSNNLFVVGLGAYDGLPYIGAWQEGSVWRAGTTLPNTGKAVTDISIVRASPGRLQVFGQGVYRPFQVSKQDPNGAWQAGVGELP